MFRINCYKVVFVVFFPLQSVKPHAPGLIGSNRLKNIKDFFSVKKGAKREQIKGGGVF